MQEGTAADKDLRADGQLAKLVAHYVRTSNANYHEIDQRLKGGGGTNNRGGGNTRQGGASKRSGGGSYQISGNKFQVDTTTAVVDDEETTEAQTKWTPARGHILNWASGANRHKFYVQKDADDKRLCDVKNCRKALSNSRFKSAKELQTANDEKYADGEHWTPQKPFGPFKWGTCADCFAGALNGDNDGFITYRDDFRVKLKGNKKQRAAAAKLDKPNKTPDQAPEAKPQTKTDDGAGEADSVEDQLELQKLKVELLEAKAQELKLEAANAKLARQVRQNTEDGYGTEGSQSSSTGSARQRRDTRTVVRGRGRGSTAGQQAIADRESESDDE